jgi:hypothetical protein
MITGKDLLNEIYNLEINQFKNMIQNHTYDYIAKPVLNTYLKPYFLKSFSQFGNYSCKPEYSNENTLFWCEYITIHNKVGDDKFSMEYNFMCDYDEPIDLIKNASLSMILDYIKTDLKNDINKYSKLNLYMYKPYKHWVKCSIT